MTLNHYTLTNDILDFALAPANHSDGALAAQLLEDKAGLTVLGDKGDRNAPLQAQLATYHDLTLLTPGARTNLPNSPQH